MYKLALALSGAAFVMPVTLQAQVQAPAVAPTPQPAAMVTGQVDNVLRSGTPVPLRMMEALTTKGKKLKTGQRFNLEVAEAVSVNGHVVIPGGSPAVGEVTEVRNKGMWGKSGRINARVLYVRANGRQIRLTGQLDDKGVTGTAGVVGAVALVPVAGFFMTGTSATIPLGAPVNGFVDEDIAFTPGAAQPAPMALAPSAPVSPAAAPQAPKAN
ncbi:hypothetical protein COC42_12395 [Sphingomonas spermidinifaciens]|uniref:DUF5666 domain-containing protein n=1 Tax=Sphingomonas spermidinifaciens TaxID=1141889 RepID=A0A2A4B2F7_9SPHN|nr:hypothetical protein [Sphingomonas spermidinifaciens]PCD02247.1 hypothetical protein COC42_12395 [Sphingomonas spermidinifaciens]